MRKNDASVNGGFANWSWIVALSLVLMFFIFNIVLGYRSIRLLESNHQSIANTMQVRTLIKDLKTDILSAESGQRGYLLTSDPQYLERYHTSISAIDSHLLVISVTATEVPEQKQRFERLYYLMKEKVDELEETVQLVKEEQNRKAIIQVRTDRGVKIMREIVMLIEEMEIKETELLILNQRNAEENRRFVLKTIILTNIVGLILIASIYLLHYKQLKKVAELNYEVELANSELEEKVITRTKELKVYSEELERSNRDLEEFAFVASHDLQEPLRKIRAFGDRLLQNYTEQLDDRGADYLVRMYKASERMSLLINDLLNFSRIASQRKNYQKTDLNEVVAKVVDDLEFAIEEANADIEVDNLPTIDADSSQMSQVFLNLFSNALKFRKPDIRPKIKVSYVNNIDHQVNQACNICTVKVSDNGIGFDSQYKDRVFNLFQRLHGREEFKGTGIGLALCRKIVVQHHGTITVDSVPDRGCTFTIQLPIIQEVAS